MGTQQMMELLLARMDANTKAMQEKVDTNLKELKEDIKTNQAKTDINLKETKEEILSIQSELEEKRMAEQIADQEVREAERKVD